MSAPRDMESRDHYTPWGLAAWQQEREARRMARMENSRVSVRGVYLTGWTAGRPERLRSLLELVDRTELNAVVVDVKDSTGRTTYPSELKTVREVGATSNRIPNLDRVLADIKRRRIYPIARLVVFQDPVLAAARPDLAVRNAAGGLWRDRAGYLWTDPYSQEVWDYNLAIAREVVAKGFREIQFDYVRFPSDGDTASAVYPNADGRTRERVIADFLAYARKELASFGVFTSADIFGLVPTVKDGMKIGQYYEYILDVVDYVSPMAYPSHYHQGVYGLPDPDAAPYETVLNTMLDAVRRRQEGQAIIRPWLQDFSLRHRYGEAELRGQIQAVRDAGLEEWMLWNPANVYTVEALRDDRRPWGPRPVIR